MHNISNKTFIAGDIPVTPILVYHLNMPVLGFRFGDFTYITDASRIDNDEKEKIKGSKVIVVNALRKEEHISHFTFEQAIALMEELKPKKAYFTHISDQLGKHAEIIKQLPDWIEPAYDGLVISG